MTATFERTSKRWRIAGWSTAVLLLLLPLLAMQVTREVAWSAGDFILFGAMLAVAGGTIELAARKAGNIFYRAGAVVAVAACFLLIWVNLAVGIFGSDDNDANLLFAGVIAVAAGGAFAARFRAAGLATAMIAAAAAQTLVGIIALAAGLASPGPVGLYEVAVGTGLFGGLWLLSAWLFRTAAKRTPGASPQAE